MERREEGRRDREDEMNGRGKRQEISGNSVLRQRLSYYALAMSSDADVLLTPIPPPPPTFLTPLPLPPPPSFLYSLLLSLPQRSLASSMDETCPS